MKDKFVKMLLDNIKPEVVVELVIGILAELAKKTTNTLDDRAVQILANALGVKVK